MYDQTVEEIEFLDHPAYSIKFHLATVTVLRDASNLFGRFLEMKKSLYLNSFILLGTQFIPTHNNYQPDT